MKPIYVRLGTSKAAALPGSHCLTGCDTHVDIFRYRREDCLQGLHWSNTSRTHSTKSTWCWKNAFCWCCFRLWEVLCAGSWAQKNKQTNKQKQKQTNKKHLQANTAEKLKWKRFQSQPGGKIKSPQLLLVRDINIIIFQAYMPQHGTNTAQKRQNMKFKMAAEDAFEKNGTITGFVRKGIRMQKNLGSTSIGIFALDYITPCTNKDAKKPWFH